MLAGAVSFAQTQFAKKMFVDRTVLFLKQDAQFNDNSCYFIIFLIAADLGSD